MRYPFAITLALIHFFSPAYAVTVVVPRGNDSDKGTDGPRQPLNPVILWDAPIPVKTAREPRLGRGYNIFTGDFSREAECIKKTRDDQSGGAEKLTRYDHQYINTVSDMTSYQNATSSSMDFSLAYKMVTAGFGSGANSSSYFNSVDHYARIYRNMATRFVERVGGDWGAGAQPLLKKISQKDGMERFIEVCGTHYIQAIWYGHRVDTTIHFRLNTSKYAKTDRDSFSLSIGKIFSADYSETTEEKNIRDSSKLEVIENSSGVITADQPDITTTPNSIRNLVKFARIDFKNSIAALKPEQSVPVAFELAPYYSLNIAHQERFARTDEIMPLIVTAMDDYERLLTNTSELSFAINLDDATRSLIYKDDKTILSDKLDKAKQYALSFREFVKNKCIDVISNKIARTDLEACQAGLLIAISAKMLTDTKAEKK